VLNKNCRYCVRTLVASGALGVAGLASPAARAEYIGNKFVEPGTGNVLEYNLFVPDGYDAAKKYPLMVVLHAANTNQIPPPRTLSSDGKGWSGTFINTPHQQTDPAFFMVPISQTNASGWGDPTLPITEEEKFEGRLTVSVLQGEVMAKYNIDPDRLYITGPSMGGRGTWDIIRRYPALFAAAAPAAAPASTADAAIFKNQNIWATCGEVDPIVQGQRDAILAIRAEGGNPIYTELARHGHDSWRSVYPDPQFVPWMFAQRRGVPWWTVSEAPTSVQGAALTPDWPTTVPPAELPSTFDTEASNGSESESDVSDGTPTRGVDPSVAMAADLGSTGTSSTPTNPIAVSPANAPALPDPTGTTGGSDASAMSSSSGGCSVGNARPVFHPGWGGGLWLLTCLGWAARRRGRA
jgi:hypothetical protein